MHGEGRQAGQEEREDARHTPWLASTCYPTLLRYASPPSPFPPPILTCAPPLLPPPLRPYLRPVLLLGRHVDVIHEEHDALVDGSAVPRLALLLELALDEELRVDRLHHGMGKCEDTRGGGGAHEVVWHGAATPKGFTKEL